MFFSNCWWGSCQEYPKKNSEKSDFFWLKCFFTTIFFVPKFFLTYFFGGPYVDNKKFTIFLARRALSSPWKTQSFPPLSLHQCHIYVRHVIYYMTYLKDMSDVIYVRWHVNVIYVRCHKSDVKYVMSHNDMSVKYGMSNMSCMSDVRYVRCNICQMAYMSDVIYVRWHIYQM